MHYLDFAATTAVHPDVAARIHDALLHQFANPSSLYTPGFEAEQTIAESRKTLAGALGCAAGDVIFTASGTESSNLAVLGLARARKNRGAHLVATGYEHPAVHAPLAMLAEREGFTLTLVPPGPAGEVDPGQFLAAIRPDTVLAAAMHVNNETGAVLDVAALAGAAKRKNPRLAFHVDGVQGFTRYPLALSITEIDSYAITGHKLHAPKGVGALYLRRGLHILPVLAGGGQERALRPGTENLPYIVGFAEAVRLALAAREATLAHVKALNAQLRTGLAQLGQFPLNSPAGAWPGILNVSFPGYRSEVLLHDLERHGVYVSSGSACSKGQPSHTLAAMGLPKGRIEGALRISFGLSSTPQDMEALLAGLAESLATRAHAGAKRRGETS